MVADLDRDVQGVVSLVVGVLADGLDRVPDHGRMVGAVTSPVERWPWPRSPLRWTAVPSCFKKYGTFAALHWRIRSSAHSTSGGLALCPDSPPWITQLSRGRPLGVGGGGERGRHQRFVDLQDPGEGRSDRQGGSRGRRARKKGRAGSSPVQKGGQTHGPAAGASRPLDGRTSRGRSLIEIEADGDRLIFSLTAAGGLEQIEDELRKVRRLLYRRLAE
jgi:hypothetical protein